MADIEVAESAVLGRATAVGVWCGGTVFRNGVG